MAISERSIIGETEFDDEVNLSERNKYVVQKENLEKLLNLVEELKISSKKALQRLVIFRYIQLTLILLFIAFLIFGYNKSTETESKLLIDKLSEKREEISILTRRKESLQDRLFNELSGDTKNNSSGITGEGPTAIRIREEIININRSIEDTNKELKEISSNLSKLEPSLLKFLRNDVLVLPIHLIFILALLFLSFLKKNYKQIIMSDKAALSSGLQILRETFELTADSENWSALSRAEFRIRLSRFSLEEEPKTSLNFF
jgi:hypothetical protein